MILRCESCGEPIAATGAGCLSWCLPMRGLRARVEILEETCALLALALLDRTDGVQLEPQTVEALETFLADHPRTPPLHEAKPEPPEAP